MLRLNMKPWSCGGLGSALPPAATARVSVASTASRLSTLSERAGLIERRSDPNDRRGKLIALTAAGRRIIDQTITRHVANEKQLLSVLTTAEQEKLNALLKKLIAGQPVTRNPQPATRNL
jgi:hypothetical protein